MNATTLSFRLGSGATQRSTGSSMQKGMTTTPLQDHLGWLQLMLFVVSAARQPAPAGGHAANGEVGGEKSFYSIPAEEFQHAANRFSEVACSATVLGCVDAYQLCVSGARH